MFTDSQHDPVKRDKRDKRDSFTARGSSAREAQVRWRNRAAQIEQVQGGTSSTAKTGRVQQMRVTHKQKTSEGGLRSDSCLAGLAREMKKKNAAICIPCNVICVSPHLSPSMYNTERHLQHVASHFQVHGELGVWRALMV